MHSEGGLKEKGTASRLSGCAEKQLKSARHALFASADAIITGSLRCVDGDLGQICMFFRG
jgi:hypothetical protein